MSIHYQISDESIFDILNLNEDDVLDEDEIIDCYAEEDARTLKEYGF